MIRKLLRLINRREEEGGMHQAAILLGVFSLISQLIGLWRDRMLAHTIGPGPLLDVYYSAFRIPDFIYLSIASLASITVLMPFLISHMNSSGKDSARKFFNDVLSGFFLLLTIVSVIVFFAMPRLAHLIAPGFSMEQLHQLVGVSRIMLLSPIFMGLSNMLGTVTQLMRKFVVFSLSPIFYNLGIVFGILFLYPKYGVYGLAGGVVVGALMHLLIQIPTIIKAGFTPKLAARLEHSTLRQVVSLSLPRTLGLSMNSIALIVILAMASKLSSGSISIFNFSYNLETTPVGIIGISYAVASFPLLSEAFARGDMDKWQKSIISALRQIIFWSLPLTALFIVVRAQIVRITLGTGAFSWNDTKITAAAFALFTIGLIAQNMILVSVRAFYSAHNTKTPLIINAFCSMVIIALAYFLLHAFQTMPLFRYFIESLLRVPDIDQTAVLMLPLAYSIGTILNAWLHWVDLRKQYLTSVGNLPRTLFEAISASFAVGVVAYGSLNILSYVFNMNTFFGVLMQGGIACLLGTAAGLILLYLLKSESLFEILNAARKKFWKVDFVAPEKEAI
jgi:putative peptidoglycan lipid II flippase